MNSEKDEEMRHCYLDINHKNKNEIIGIDKIRIKQMELSFLLADDKEYNIKKIIDAYLYDYIPKDKGLILLIHNFYSLYEKNNNIKDKYEQCINNLLDNRRIIQHSENIILTVEKIRQIGIIILCGYKKLMSFNILNINNLSELINKTKSNNINIINELYHFCFKKNLEPYTISKEKFFENNNNLKNKLLVPAEFIFLDNLFSKIKNLIIDFDWPINDYTGDDTYLFIFIILNKKFIFPNLNGINLELNNESLTKKLCDIYQYKLIIYEKEYNNTIESIDFNQSYKKLIQRKWTFKNDYISLFDNKIKDNTNLNNNDKNEQKKNEIFFMQYKNIFDSLILILGIIPIIKNIIHFSLSFPINLTREIEKYFQLKFKLIIPFKENFHFMNFLLPLNEVTNLYLNFNSLDFLSFRKILSIIDSYEQIKVLNISFFSEAISYCIPSLFKLYQNLKEIEPNNFNEKKNRFEDKFSEYILNKLLKKFEENLNNFFILFLVKKSLKEISIFLDIPEILLSKFEYIMTIIKFILNFIILFDGDNKNIKKLKILSPYIRFDSRSFPSIGEIIDIIDYQKNNQILEHIYFQFQFYHIYNISNFITTNLITISIGYLDEITFIHFSNFISKFSFTNISKLKYISIQLLSFVCDFIKIKLNIKKLFNIYIKDLKEINFITNLKIKNNEINDIANILDLNFTEKIYFESNNNIENKIEKLNYFSIQDNQKYIILKRLFKGNINIIKQCLSFLYPTKKLKMFK